LFAENFTLSHTYFNPKDAEEIIKQDLQQINQWSKQWLVEFNLSKTIFINFSLLKKRDALNLSFKNVPILQVCQHKHLGIFLTENLRWDPHISYCIGKANKKLGLLFRQKSKLNCLEKIL